MDQMVSDMLSFCGQFKGSTKVQGDECIPGSPLSRVKLLQIKRDGSKSKKIIILCGFSDNVVADNNFPFRYTPQRPFIQ